MKAVKRFWKKLSNKTHQVLRTDISPNRIAGSFALGTALAILPTPGISILIGLLLSFLFKKIHTLSLALAFIVWNPFIVTPLYVLSYQIGDFFFASRPISPVNIEFANIFVAFSRRFLLGNLIVSLSFAIVSFFIIRFLVIQKRKLTPLTDA